MEHRTSERRRRNLDCFPPGSDVYRRAASNHRFRVRRPRCDVGRSTQNERMDREINRLRTELSEPQEIVKKGFVKKTYRNLREDAFVNNEVDRNAIIQDPRRDPRMKFSRFELKNDLQCFREKFEEREVKFDRIRSTGDSIYPPMDNVRIVFILERRNTVRCAFLRNTVYALSSIFSTMSLL